MQLSLCTELFHTAALIHDDIMDKAKTRRGGPTVHEYFARKLQIRHSGDPAEGGGLQNRFWTSQNDDEAHELGINLAILAGDLCLIWADEIFSLSKIDRRLLLKVKKQFDLLREEVIFGQSLDLIKVEPCTRFHLLKIYEYKTARYSFVRPLLLGAVLAEADKKQKEAISNYAIPVGIAFQIQDDLLDSETELLGTKKECKDLAKDLINKGKRAIIEYSSQTRYNGVLAIEAKEFLLELADYSVTRQS
ncbi:polyprenyl synthetase family protein [Candidatus Gottesmanbacteria bacterium]|nr:polyprenyl synthetase family protein [Candidatus Gottesmanbacteria bacterium]